MSFTISQSLDSIYHGLLDKTHIIWYNLKKHRLNDGFPRHRRRKPHKNNTYENKERINRRFLNIESEKL